MVRRSIYLLVLALGCEASHSLLSVHDASSVLDAGPAADSSLARRDAAVSIDVGADSADRGQDAATIGCESDPVEPTELGDRRYQWDGSFCSSVRSSDETAGYDSQEACLNARKHCIPEMESASLSASQGSYDELEHFARVVGSCQAQLTGRETEAWLTEVVLARLTSWIADDYESEVLGQIESLDMLAALMPFADMVAEGARPSRELCLQMQEQYLALDREHEAVCADTAETFVCAANRFVIACATGQVHSDCTRLSQVTDATDCSRGACVDESGFGDLGARVDIHGSACSGTDMIFRLESERTVRIDCNRVFPGTTCGLHRLNGEIPFPYCVRPAP